MSIPLLLSSHVVAFVSLIFTFLPFDSKPAFQWLGLGFMINSNTISSHFPVSAYNLLTVGQPWTHTEYQQTLIHLAHVSIPQSSAIDCLEKLVSKMIHYVLSGTLNCTHSLSHSRSIISNSLLLTDVFYHLSWLHSHHWWTWISPCFKIWGSSPYACPPTVPLMYPYSSPWHKTGCPDHRCTWEMKLIVQWW